MLYTDGMLRTRISFMNELALLAEELGADIEMVRKVGMLWTSCTTAR